MLDILLLKRNIPHDSKTIQQVLSLLQVAESFAGLKT
jgi:hypothetical protein